MIGYKVRLDKTDGEKKKLGLYYLWWPLEVTAFNRNVESFLKGLIN
jgi:hypothetical protein